MCGIYCCISRHGFYRPSTSLKSLLTHRGPDSIGQRDVKINKFYVSFIASVLSLRGENITFQPLYHDETGSILCWNGEAWKLNNSPISGNDSQVIFDQLLAASTSTSDPHPAILETFSRICGPYAYVFYDSLNGKVYFGRDCLGRRSMVRCTRGNGDLIISSIPNTELHQTWNEVEADGMYVFSLPSSPFSECSSDSLIEHVPMVYSNEETKREPSMLAPFPKLNTTIPSNPAPQLNLSSNCISALDTLLVNSMLLRTRNIPGAPSTPLGVLFSGGLDSALLAYMAHRVLPESTSVDLLNVAFQNPRIHAGGLEDPYSTCPDRITALSAYSELRQAFPGRNFRMICINIPYSETVAHRDTVISLMHPHNTEMDLSIALALYFASRGIGNIYNSESGIGEAYTTATRVLISGLGADELFAGYERHAIGHGRHGHAKLIEELALDFHRLGKRNLGRDDRVTSHWGREVRYPFLDEDLVAWAVNAPVWEKCGFGQSPSTSEPNGPELEPSKLALRLLAWKYELKGIAKEKKRAIQFGSRTAKMHTGKSKGTDVLGIS